MEHWNANYEPLILEVIHWAIDQERFILEQGEELTPDQKIDAHLVGILNIEKVRIMVVDSIPYPESDAIQVVAQKVGLNASHTSGMTLGHGIFIRKDRQEDRRLILHEMAHIKQYERFGSIPQFMQQYLQECLFHGYRNSPLELEAIETEKQIP